MEGRAEEGVAALRVLRVAARLLAGFEGRESSVHEKIAAGPQQPRSSVLRGERAGYVNNPPRLQLDLRLANSRIARLIVWWPAQPVCLAVACRKRS